MVRIKHRFARARAADEAEDLAAEDVERQMVDDRRGAEADDEVAHADHGFVARHAYNPIPAKNTANKPSSRKMRTIDLTTDAVVLSPSEVALPSTSKPSTQATSPIIERHERRLDEADLERRQPDRLAQPLEIGFGRHAGIEPAHQAGAVERGHRAEKSQERHRDDERDDARQHQNLDRIEPHGAQRVDLLAHLHGAEFGGVGAAGAAGHHDAGDEHADFAQHQDRDHVDDIGVGAEGAETQDALLRENGADQERGEKDDRDGAQPDAIELIDRRGQPQPPRMGDGRQDRRRHRAEHVRDQNDRPAHVGDGAADLVEPDQDGVVR